MTNHSDKVDFFEERLFKYSIDDFLSQIASTLVNQIAAINLRVRALEPINFDAERLILILYEWGDSWVFLLIIIQTMHFPN